MTERRHTWVALAVAGLTLSVSGVLLLESTPWFVQHTALGLGLLLTLFAVLRAASDTGDTTT